MLDFSYYLTKSTLSSMRSILLYLLFCTIFCSSSYAAFEESLPINLEWDKQDKLIHSTLKKHYYTQHFKGGIYLEENDFFPLKQLLIDLPYTAEVELRIENAIYESTELPKNLDKSLLDSEISLKHTIVYNRKRPQLSITFIPFKVNAVSGKVERLVSGSISIRAEKSFGPNASAQKKLTMLSSKLSSGNWYKIRLAEDGIYAIDKTMLDELGMGSVSFDMLNVFGNGGGMLEEDAGIDRAMDIEAIASMEVDNNNNGLFDEGDLLLFYGESPHQFFSTESGLKYETHLYSNWNYYFINADAESAKRMTTADYSSQGASESISSYDAFAVHELEQRNLIASGREWFGDYFDIETSHDFSFSFPGLITSEPIWLQTRIAARASGSPNTFEVRVNGSPAQELTLPYVSLNYTAPYASIVKQSSEVLVNSENVNIEVARTFSTPSDVAWLDYILLQAKSNLNFNNSSSGQLVFRNLNSTAIDSYAEYDISGASNLEWIVDVSDKHNHKLVSYSGSGTKSFIYPTDQVYTFSAVSLNSYKTAEIVGDVRNQDIHGMPFAESFILTHPDFLTQAERLKGVHSDKTVNVVTIDQVYNEFSHGTPDITAIRDMMKYFYDAASTDAEAPRYLTILGDASYDYKSLSLNEVNTNFVPTYETNDSHKPTRSYCTDDFYTYLDDSEGFRIDSIQYMPDISVGRIPVVTAEQADDYIDKLENYRSSASLGDWRNEFCLIGDDEDGNLHYNDAEDHAEAISSNYPVYNINKIYLDAYNQTSTTGGSRYPDVNEAINKQMFTGALVVNYVGHGGESGWAHERILTQTDYNSWDNFDKLPFLITATCSFTRYDNPERFSAGEALLLKKEAGAIGLMTTTRLVYANENYELNEGLLNYLFERPNNELPTIGEISRIAKGTLVSDIDNKQKFVLVGDPAMILAYPKYSINTLTVNGSSVADADTLKALSQVTITAEVVDENGNKISNFDGIAFPTVYDKPDSLQTLGNDLYNIQTNPSGSKIRTFTNQRAVIFSGQSEVKDGEFSFTFIVPQDISYLPGNGKISYYAHDGDSRDAHGFESNIVVGGISDNPVNDTEGPTVNVYMNNEEWISGGITDENPLLYVTFYDDYGINTVGTGIGHNITGFLDGDVQNTFVLNEYYEAKLNSYQEGIVRYPLSNIPEGTHTVRVKAWDVQNNPGEGETEFIVAESAEMALENVLNYPNPFTTNTKFIFQHNQPGKPLRATIRIFTVSGKLVKTLSSEFISEGFTASDIEWDGKDEFGSEIGRGVYLYQVNLVGDDESIRSEIEKLVILK